MNEPQTPQAPQVPQVQVPVYQAQEPSEESKQINQLFADMRGKQLDFLDESGKSLIERIATFLAVLFGVSALTNTFPPAYLKNNLPAKVLLICTLALYIAALLSAIRAVRPFPYLYAEASVTSKKEALAEMTAHKVRWLGYANTLFTCGSIALSLIIVVIIWKI